jgi:hypothetical protein
VRANLTRIGDKSDKASPCDSCRRVQAPGLSRHCHFRRSAALALLSKRKWRINNPEGQKRSGSSARDDAGLPACSGDLKYNLAEVLAVGSRGRISDDAIMARWRAQTWQDVTNFDGCGFGNYCFISLSLSLLMPLKPSHNLLVRGSNPCGGTIKQKAGSRRLGRGILPSTNINPIQGALDGFLPAAVSGFSLIRAPERFPLLIGLPVATHLFHIAPKTDS